MVDTAHPSSDSRARTLPAQGPVHQAFLVLRTAFVVAPIVFGADKFTNWMVDWDRYLAPVLADPLPMSPDQAMYLVGIIEIVAGIVVALHPKLGAGVVAAWLVGIILNLVLLGDYWDVALRDVGLLAGAIALQRLAAAYDPRPLLWPVRRV